MIQDIYDILEDPDNWTKNVAAEDKDGHAVSPRDSKACRFCLSGAAYKASLEMDGNVAYEKYKKYYERLSASASRNLGNNLVTVVNDDPNTTHADILRVIADA